MAASLARTALLALAVATSSPARADEALSRSPTPEEGRMMTLQLKAAGFSPCSQVTLVDGRWSCRAQDAAGQMHQLSLSNFDFAVIGRQPLR
ncbi:MAG: hypothetical protein JNK84_20405 [Phreatobacter sp.]|uniref:hypothetical protein n=1 Tax=Phreatobacter sp. TaxID=1966341 RepID=UPI001A62D498|nr:hypothetical protein [Phreatobacter sp.]MBL8571445.1 hypothetical protein [Phreatobacter sp.]